jgi:protein-S-isoprenylcysteine O-methyltransferase Ste14
METVNNQAGETQQGVIRGSITAFIFLLLIAASFFLSAGRIDWPIALVYILLTGMILILDVVVLIRIIPEFLGERSTNQKSAKHWDQVLLRLTATFGPLMIWIRFGIGCRFAWSPQISTWLVILSANLVFAGSMFTLGAMAANRFFISLVRIQAERGHYVVNSGPYRYVLYQGYLGSLFFLLFSPIMLGSLSVLIPAILIGLVVFLLTHLEVNPLKEELPGYLDYTADTHYRLVPGIW